MSVCDLRSGNCPYRVDLSKLFRNLKFELDPRADVLGLASKADDDRLGDVPRIQRALRIRTTDDGSTRALGDGPNR